MSSIRRAYATRLSGRHITWLRRDLAKGESKAVVRMLDLLHEQGAISEEQLCELTRTPAVRNGPSFPAGEPAEITIWSFGVAKRSKQ